MTIFEKIQFFVPSIDLSHELGTAEVSPYCCIPGELGDYIAQMDTNTLHDLRACGSDTMEQVRIIVTHTTCAFALGAALERYFTEHPELLMEKTIPMGDFPVGEPLDDSHQEVDKIVEEVLGEDPRPEECRACKRAGTTYCQTECQV